MHELTPFLHLLISSHNAARVWASAPSPNASAYAVSISCTFLDVMGRGSFLIPVLFLLLSTCSNNFCSDVDRMDVVLMVNTFEVLHRTNGVEFSKDIERKYSFARDRICDAKLHQTGFLLNKRKPLIMAIVFI